MSDLAMVQYGSEATEYILSAKKPKVGDVLKRNGDTWVVVEIKDGADGKSTVVLQPGSPDADRDRREGRSAL
jgi:hypothetical protein